MLTDVGLVERTWEELGCRIRPIKRWVFLRTFPLDEKIGSIHLIPKASSFFGELPHQKTIKSVVLSAGPLAKVKPGEFVAFTRLNFAWWKKLSDGCMIGWIDETQLIGYIEEM